MLPTENHGSIFFLFYGTKCIRTGNKDGYEASESFSYKTKVKANGKGVVIVYWSLRSSFKQS